MKTKRLDNYLRSYRKKSGLTQSEVGFLLGRANGAQISRYEKRRRVPPLKIALALETLLKIPASSLFPGIHDSASDDVRKRVLALRLKLAARTAKGSEALLAAHKLDWLSSLETVDAQHAKA